MTNRMTNFLVLSNPLTWVGLAFVVGMAVLTIYLLLLKMLWDGFADPTVIQRQEPVPVPVITTTVTRALELAATAGVVAPVVTPPNIAELSHEQLLKMAQERGLKGVNPRWKKETLVKRLAA